MCILMYFAPDAFPTNEELVNACVNNPDGFGWAIIADDDSRRIITGHSMDADEAIVGFLADRKEHPGQSAIFHARIATHGSTSLDNCHPFAVQHRILKGHGNREVVGEMWMAHNGILPCQPVKGDRRSDTRILAQDILMRRFPHLDSDKTRRRFEAWMGMSKVVILSTDPAYRQQSYVFNSQLGYWLKDANGNDMWYSNTSYRARTYAYTYSHTPWPTVVGGKHSYSESWDSDSGRSYGGYVLACVDCRYPVLECGCTGVIETRYLPKDQTRSLREEADDASYVEGDMTTWKCDGCNWRGGINDDAECKYCGVMFCCNQLNIACQCWDSPGTLNVSRALEARADNV